MQHKYTFYELNLMTVIVSFAGFVFENCWLALTCGYMDNRCMNLPFILGYGLAVAGFYVVIGTPNNLRFSSKLHHHLNKAESYLLYFLIAVVAVSIGEIILGTVVERKFGFEYWNYSNMPLHITKFTSIPTSIGFGLIITLFMGFCYEPLMKCIHNMPQRAVKVIGIILMIMLVTDFLYCFRSMYINQEIHIWWTKTFKTL